MNCMLRIEHLELFRQSIQGVDLNACFSPEDGEHLALKALGCGNAGSLLKVLLEAGMSRDVKERRGSRVLLRHTCPPEIAVLFGGEEECHFIAIGASAIKRRNWTAACSAILDCKDLNSGKSLIEMVIEEVAGFGEEPDAVECLKLLLKQGAAVCGSLALSVSLQCSFEVVSVTLQFAHELDLDFVDDRFCGRTALCLACEAGNQLKSCHMRLFLTASKGWMRFR